MAKKKQSPVDLITSYFMTSPQAEAETLYNVAKSIMNTRFAGQPVQKTAKATTQRARTTTLKAAPASEVRTSDGAEGQAAA